MTPQEKFDKLCKEYMAIEIEQAKRRLELQKLKDEILLKS